MKANNLSFQVVTDYFFFGFTVLEDLGAMPYTLARPILLRVDNPQKLVCHTYRSLTYLPLCLHFQGMFANTRAFH